VNSLQFLLDSGTVERIGWTLLHFVWQGAVLAALLAGMLILLHRRSAASRYAVACAVLTGMAAAPLVTFALLDRSRTAAALSTSDSSEPNENHLYTPRSPLDAGVERRTHAPAAPIRRSDTRWNPATLELAFVPYLRWLVAGWLLGVVVLSVRLLGGWLRLQRLRHRFARPAPEAWRQTLAKLCTRLRVTRPVNALQSALVHVPCALGWLRPVILLPASAWAGLPPGQLEALLAHELAHIRRHDYLVNLIQSLVETVLFYHPAVWWVSEKIRLERELCCDDLAVMACGDRLLYARALIRMEELRQPLTLAPGANAGCLRGRILRLLGQAEPTSNVSARWSAGLLLLVGLASVVALCALRPESSLATVAVAVREEQNNASEAIKKPVDAVPVELVGVTRNTLERRAQIWWKPDGTALTLPPYHYPYTYSNEQIAYEFAFRVREEDGFSYTFKGPTNKAVSEPTVPQDEARKSLANLRAVVIGRFAEEETTASLRVGVATGAWIKVDVWKDYRWEETSGNFISAAQIVFKWPRQERDDASTEITHTYVDEATRLVAFDRQGKLHESLETPGGRGKGLAQRYCSFRGLKLKDIQRFEFQKRPYDTWFTLRNISLQPGHRTDPLTTRE
jgi:beta-lactamase regulating signal transducer with metallopeptidase domain